MIEEGEDADEAPPRLSRAGLDRAPATSVPAPGANLCWASMLTPMLGDAGMVSRVGIAGLGDEDAFLTKSSDLARSGSGGRRSSITAGSRSERRAGRGGLPLVLARLALGEEAGTILLKV